VGLLSASLPRAQIRARRFSSKYKKIHRMIRVSLPRSSRGHLPLFLSRLRLPARSRCGGSFLSQPCISYIGFPPTGRAKYLLRWRHRFLLWEAHASMCSKPPKYICQNISRGPQGYPGGPNGPAAVLWDTQGEVT
jgi:hypothetical protein